MLHVRSNFKVTFSPVKLRNIPWEILEYGKAGRKFGQLSSLSLVVLLRTTKIDDTNCRRIPFCTSSYRSHKSTISQASLRLLLRIFLLLLLPQDFAAPSSSSKSALSRFPFHPHPSYPFTFLERRAIR